MTDNSRAPLAPRPLAKRVHTWIKKYSSCSGECWLWQGTTDRNGYGYVGVHGRTIPVHRVVYEFFVGTVPDGLEIDHLCRRRNCINPFHLRPVTHEENMARAIGCGQYDRSTAGITSDQTHCSRRHRLTKSNTLVKASGQIICLTCRKDNQKAYQKRKLKIAERALVGDA